MKRTQRALQIWQVLIAAAHNRQMLTYEILADLIGLGPKGKGAGVLAQTLGVLMKYCQAKRFPPITALVVNKAAGRPGKGLTTFVNLDEDRENVFNYPWYHLAPLTIEDLELFTGGH